MEKYFKLPVSGNHILATIAYFDIFSYPLTSREIFLFLGYPCDYSEFEEALQGLVRNRTIYQFGKFYCLHDEELLIRRRIDGNTNAKKLIKTAGKIAGILSWFPFVRGIAISGSLSKNFADDKSDIDLFIITTGNRLWIARTLMHGLKKLAFLINKQHLFCMNYYVDEETLVISERNIYTAIEVATLIPLQGDAMFEQFYAANTWFRDYLPNNFLRLSTARRIKMPLIKVIGEKIFSNRFGDKLDQKLMKITAARWLEKTRKEQKNSSGMILSMDATRHFSKPDPENFQQKLLKRYEEKVSKLFTEYESNYRAVH